MAEVGSEEISSIDEVVIGGNIFTFSPFALSRALSLVSINALLNEGGVSVHEYWSTEVGLWDHFSSGREDAWCSAGIHVEAGVPISDWNVLNLSS